MEMEMEVVESAGLELRASDAVAERLMAAVEALERAVDRLAGLSVAASRDGLADRLSEAEATLAGLKAGGRKTASVGSLVAKEGAAHEGAAGLDAALGSLSLEQRIAVKAGLMRAGLV